MVIRAVEKVILADSNPKVLLTEATNIIDKNTMQHPSMAGTNLEASAVNTTSEKSPPKVVAKHTYLDILSPEIVTQL